jgi:hypothetical protein
MPFNTKHDAVGGHESGQRSAARPNTFAYVLPPVRSILDPSRLNSLYDPRRRVSLRSHYRPSLSAPLAVREFVSRAAKCLCGEAVGTPFHVATCVEPGIARIIGTMVPPCATVMNYGSIGQISSSMGKLDALVFSPSSDANWISRIQTIVTIEPACLVVAVIDDRDRPQSIAIRNSGIPLVGLGVAGNTPLRQTLACNSHADRAMRAAIVYCVANVATDVADIIPVARFFRLLFTPRIRSAKQLAFALDELPSTLTSRFFRAGLPSPRRFVAHARLVWAAHVAESSISTSAIARRVCAASPQGFHRSVRTLTGIPVAEFRQAYTGEGLLNKFVSDLVRPYRVDLLRQLRTRS